MMIAKVAIVAKIAKLAMIAILAIGLIFCKDNAFVLIFRHFAFEIMNFAGFGGVILPTSCRGQMLKIINREIFL